MPKSKEILDKYLANGVEYVFSGHLHDNKDERDYSGVKKPENNKAKADEMKDNKKDDKNKNKKEDKKVRMFITSALGWQSNEKTKAGYRVVKVTEKEITSQYTPVSSAKTLLAATSFVLMNIFLALYAM